MTVHMRLGGVYVNACAAKDNPHRVGVFIGRRGKLIELLHDDGKRTSYDSSRSLVSTKFNLFDRASMRNWFANVSRRVEDEAERVGRATWRETFGGVEHARSEIDESERGSSPDGDGRFV